MSSTGSVFVFLAVLLLFFSDRPRHAYALESEVVAIRYEQGAALGSLPATQAHSDGLTVLDLGDSFVPNVLAEEPALGELGFLPYANTYRALADERFEEAPDPARARDERYLELYGVFPSFRVLRERLLDDTRHACHAQLDLTPLVSFSGRLTMVQPSSSAASEKRRGAVATLQAILRCDGLLPAKFREGVFEFATATALMAFQRRHMIVSWAVVDATTRNALLTPSLDRDFEAVLRALRERVVAATGLVEDGSAASEQLAVVGRLLDSAELRVADPRGPLLHAAPDLISQATDAAARSLGWTSPEATRAWFQGMDEPGLHSLRVALRLPPLPPYHAEHMELRAEIDRGDVWYGYPYRPNGSRRPQPVERRPTLVLYARTAEGEVPLIRWNTTIGGFQPESLADGRIVFRYKSSEPGPRVWREVLAAPAWLPPDSTPDAELVRAVRPGHYVLKKELFGPGYASAYGMVMMRHELQWFARGVEARDQVGAIPQYQDRGVRTHGSVNYRSILHGQSHGCHRLFNHLALRLASFLVVHRYHVHEGLLPVRYGRQVRYKNVHETLSIASRGYGYELTPPVPVLVLEGRVRGGRKQPIAGDLPLPPGFHF